MSINASTLRRAGGYAAIVAAILAAPLVRGQNAGPDWTQFRGPNRDGSVPGFTAPATWPQQLVKKWRVDVGEGYATPLVVGANVYTFTRQGGNDVMRALDAATGKVKWEAYYAAAVTVNPAAQEHGPGPKSTPTFANGRLYSLGMGGRVTAFDASNGKILWQKPGDKILPLYGTAASPLVERDLVIVHVGGNDMGALTAFDAATGNVKWTWNGDGPSYASAIATDIDGVRQVIALTQENLVGLSAIDGRLLWRRPFSTQFTQNIITPIVAGQTLILAGYEKPTAALRIVRMGTQWRADDVWQNERTSFYMANPVVAGDAIFGLSHRNSGQFVQLDLKTGKTTWTGKPREATNAAIAHAGNTILALKDDGELVVGRVAPAGFQELKRYKVADTPTWAQPAISGNRIFVKDATAVTLWTLN